jgi:hypothetical protein
MPEENLKPDQIYTADKSELCWKGLPARILVLVEHPPRHKRFNQILCVNTSEHMK